MIPEPTTAGELESLARSLFPGPPFTEAEIKLLRAAPIGEFAVCGSNMDPKDSENAASEGHKWPTERQIRAALIFWLCVNRQAKVLVGVKGVQIYGAQITAQLDLSDVTLPFPLRLWHCRVMEELTLRGANIPELDLQGTSVPFVFADGIVVKDNVFLRNGFHTDFEVRLLRAQIGGTLDCNGGVFSNPPQPGIKGSGQALSADGAIVRNDVFLNDDFRAKGEVRLLSAQIAGNLVCDRGVFENPCQPGIEGTGRALNADGVVVKGFVFLRWAQVDGGVRFVGAQVGETLDCEGTTIRNPGQLREDGTGYAMEAGDIVVNGSVFLRNGFHADGVVAFPGARIGGDVFVEKAIFKGGLLAQRAVIKGGFFWQKIAEPVSAKLDLLNASADALGDDSDSWPSQGNLRVDGFVYDRISEGPRNATARLKWLGLEKPFASQPYHQLAKVLKDSGDEDGARAVLVKLQRLQRDKDWYARPWSGLLRWSIGYGYYPWRALWGLTILSSLAWIIFRRAHLAGAMVPTEKESYEYFKDRDRNEGAPPPHYARFSPSVYSIENSLPLVRLGQADRWQPDPQQIPVLRERLLARLGRIGLLLISLAFWSKVFGLLRSLVTSPRSCWASFSRVTLSPVFLQRFLWFQIILGWILATLFAAGVTGIIRKD